MISEIATTIGKLDIGTLSSAQIADAIRHRKFIERAWAGGSLLMQIVYDRAAKLLDEMQEGGKE